MDNVRAFRLTETSGASGVRPSIRCLSIVMPVFNERLTIHPILRRVLKVPIPKEIIIVDDGSTDGTRDFLDRWIATSGAEEEPVPSPAAIKVIFHEKNQGKGASIRTGIRAAEGDVLVIQDADLEYDPADYLRLLEPIVGGEADVVFGSRFLGERRRVLAFWHQARNIFLTFLSNMCTNLTLTDMETGYKMFKTEILKRMPLRSNRFGFEPEVTAKVAKMRCRIFEVPISYAGRTVAEGKKINWKDGLVAVWTILKYFFRDDLYEGTAGLRTLRILEGAGSYNLWLFRQCRPHLGRRVLELGGGVGHITKFLVDRDVVVTTDTDPFFVEELRRTFQEMPNVKVESSDPATEPTAEALRGTYRPDSLIGINVLERFKDDVGALKALNRTLAPGGTAVFVVPAHARLFCEMDANLEYVRRYDKPALRAALEQSGFEVKVLRYFNWLGAVAWWVNGRVLRRKVIPSRQLRMFDWLLRILDLERNHEPPFGMSILAVATKRSDAA